MFVSFCSYAIDTKSVYNQIDLAFDDKSEEELATVLETYKEDSNYYLLENYTLKKISSLVLKDEFDYALKANLIIIDNNLDNTEAIELYSNISQGLQRQESLRQEKLLKEQKTQSHKQELEKKNQKLYVDSKGTYLYKKRDGSKDHWYGSYGLINLVEINQTDTGYNSLRYGLSFNVMYEHEEEEVIVALEGGTDFVLIPFYNNDKTILGSATFVPSLCIPSINRNLSLRVGIGSLYNLVTGDNSDLVSTMITPIFGIGIRPFKVGELTLRGSYDYYLGHVMKTDIKSSMGWEFMVDIPISKLERIQTSINLGVRDTLYILDKGIENKAKLILGLGVKNER